MSKPWRKVLNAWEKVSPTGKAVLLVAVLSFFTSALLLWPAWFHYIWPPTSYVELVKEGDDAFKGYRYSEAIQLYRRAENQLDAFIKFENESPSRNVIILERYYNSKMFINARIQLVLIAADVSRLETRDTR